MASDFLDVVSESFGHNKDAYKRLAHKIWERPELMYEEHFAHDLLTDFLAQEGFAVQKQYAGVSTAFRAEYTTPNFQRGEHPTVAVLCEYDALPEIGHACGHNLIAESGVASACAVRDVFRHHGALGEISGKLVVLGCPAEEGGGGKIDLINAGAFDDVDFAMMVHPFSHDVLHCITLGIERCFVEYHGKASHASCAPWEGVNALDAAMSAYNNVSYLRQQMRPDWRVHAIIMQGGDAANIIPEYSKSQYFVRCQRAEDLPVLKEKVTRCFESAAQATGCSLTLKWEPKPYLPLRSNRAMADTFGKFAAKEGKVQWVQESLVYGADPNLHGSSDIGNLSMVVPTIHPRFFAGEQTLIHTRDFQKLAGTDLAQKHTLRISRIMALTALELFVNPALREEVKKEFAAGKSFA